MATSPSRPATKNRVAPVEEVVDDPELGLLAPEEEAAPRPWTQEEWRKKHEREALHLEINQKLVQECDARIIELEKQHKKELSQQLADLTYEVHCLRSVRDPNPAIKSWGEKGLEELRVKRENAAKQLADPGDGPDVESRTQELESIARSINSSATDKSPAYEPRLPQHPRVQLIASRRTNAQPPRKPVTKSTSAECPTHDDLSVMSG